MCFLIDFPFHPVSFKPFLMFTSFFIFNISSLIGLFQLTNMFNSSSYLKCICILLTSKSCVSSPYCSSFRTSCRFCFYFHYLFYSSLHSKFTFVLYILVKHYLISTFDIVFFLWILMTARRESSLFPWPHILLLLLSPPAPLHSLRFLLILQLLPSFLLLPICLQTFFPHPYFQLLPMH